MTLNNELTGNHGDRIPALFLFKDGNFYLASSIGNDPNLTINIKFVLGETYHMIIRQYKNESKYWYEVIVNDKEIYSIENNKTSHCCPEALLRIKKITRTGTYTGSLYDTWGVLKIFFKTFQLRNFEKSTNLCFPYAKLGAKLEENGHF